MSPIALVYLLLAASPLFTERYHEKSPFGSNYDNELEYSTSPFDWNTESSEWNTESSEETSPFNWLSRRSSPRRSILKELFRGETPFDTEYESTPIFESLFRNVKPWMVERLVKLIRNVEPETMVVLKKLLRKNIFNAEPESRIFDVIRRVVKESTRMHVPRRSILNELVRSEESYSPIFESRRVNHVEKLMKKIVEKVIRSEEIPESVKEHIIRRIVKSSKHVSPIVELLSAMTSRKSFGRFESEPIFGRHHEVEKLVEKMLFNKFEHRDEESTPSTWTIRRMLENIWNVKPEAKFEILRTIVKKALRHEVEPEEVTKTLCNFCWTKCERSSYNRVCKVCDEVCTPSSSWEHADVKERIFEFLPYIMESMTEDKPWGKTFGKKHIYGEEKINKVEKQLKKLTKALRETTTRRDVFDF